MGRAMQKHVFGHMPRACINGEQRPELYFAYAQDDLNLHILHMLEGTVSHGVAHLIQFVESELL